jgi:hypothetical protein
MVVEAGPTDVGLLVIVVDLGQAVNENVGHDTNNTY